MKDEFIRLYGQAAYDEIVERAGIHSNSMGSQPPVEELERFVFGLLEIIDFQCCKYGDFDKLSEQEVRAFLIDHRKEVGAMPIKPPSYLGLLAGAFGFLADDAK